MAHRGNKDGVNVQVILRCRPYNKAELARAELCRQFVLCKEDAKEVNILLNAGGGKQLERSFHFDKVFGPESGQERLYKQAVSPIVEEVLEGFNCTIFAYGQTGTGKTYTMEGGDRDSADGNNLSDIAGVIPRAIHQIFTTLDKNDSEYTVKCSFLELYNEETTDLLAVGERQDQKLRILEDKSGVVIQGLEEFIVKSSVDIYALLDRGSAKRKTAETQLNKQSSRSHSVFCITVHMREIAADGEEVIKIGKLYLVDLAGSENVSRSGAAGTVAKEAGSINKSLLTLGRVITALVEGSGHIPYRDSKLTRLLRDSLGGKTKTCIIATIAPTAGCQDETLSTLDYAHRAKNIRNRPEVNQKISKTAHIKELNAEIDRLKAELFATREKNGVYLPVDQFEQREEYSKANAVRLEALEAEIQLMTANHKSHAARLEGDISRLHQELQEASAACARARLGIQERDFLIATHKRSEKAILAQGAALTGEVQRAGAAIDALHARLARDVAREQGNTAVVQELRRVCEARFASLGAAFAKAAFATREGLQQSGDQLAGLLSSNDAQLAALQARMEEAWRHAEAVAAAAAAGAEGARSTALEHLQAVQRADAEFAARSKEAGMESGVANGLVLQSIANLQAAHKLQLDAGAALQREAADALQAAVHQIIVQGGAGLLSVQGVTEAALDKSMAAMDTQQESLESLQTGFVRAMQEEQEELMARVVAMVRDFTGTKLSSLCGQLASVVASAQSAKHHMSTDKQQAQSAAAVAQQALQGEEAKAEDAAKHYRQKHEEHTAALQESLHGETASCDQLRAQLQQQAVRAGEDGDGHLATIAALVSSAAEAVDAQAARGNDSCRTAMHSLKRRYEELGEAAADGHRADRAASLALQDITKATLQHVTDFANTHTADVAALAARVGKAVGQEYAEDPEKGVVPEKAVLEFPPENWCEEMCTPGADLLLAEFRRQRDGDAVEDDSPSQAAEDPAARDAPPRGAEAWPEKGEEAARAGLENTDPNVADAPGAQFKSKIPGLKDKAQTEGEALASEGLRRKRQKA